MLGVVGRLRPGVTIETARADLAGISTRMFPIWASSFQDRVARLTPYSMREIVIGDAGKSLAILSGAVALVLIIVLANVTNLVLVRSAGRRKEFALRTALGARTTRVARLLLTESLVLSVLGALAGLAFGSLLIRALQLAGPRLPRVSGVSLDLRTMLFLFAVAALSGIVIAVYPALFGGRDTGDALRSSTRNSGGRGMRALQNGLVVMEFALALPLLAASGLLLHSFVNLQRVDPGFDPKGLVTLRIALPQSQQGAGVNREAFWRDVYQTVAATPGVAAVGLTASLPPDDQNADFNNFDLLDRPTAPGGQQPTSPWVTISPGYFRALGVKVLAGRDFDNRDDMNAPPVILVTRAWERKYFGNESAVGKQMLSGGCSDCPPTTIIGVVSDVKYAGLDDIGEAIYTPFTQTPQQQRHIVVRTRGDAGAMLQTLRERLHTIDPEIPLTDGELMTSHISQTIGEPRRWTMLIGGFAAVAVLLAALGVFGVMSYIVAQQQREIGVRLALGATPARVTGLVLGRGVALGAVGVAAGLGIAIGSTRLIGHVLFDIGTTDVPTFLAVSAMLLAIAALACYLPGRRAGAIDPMRVMAAE
jgi:putative ABC transport system permease protein